MTGTPIQQARTNIRDNMIKVARQQLTPEQWAILDLLAALAEAVDLALPVEPPCGRCGATIQHGTPTDTSHNNNGTMHLHRLCPAQPPAPTPA